MAYYNVCPHCGCNLDPGEKCDCESIKAREQETSRIFYSQILMTDEKRRSDGIYVRPSKRRCGVSMRNKCLFSLGLVFVISLTSMVAFAFSFVGTPADELDSRDIIVQSMISDEANATPTATSVATTAPEQETEKAERSKIGSMDWDSDDAYRLAKIAMAEAESEDTEGKALVMLVVLNRVWSDEFPDTIEDVIFQKGQFSPISNGRYDEVEPDEDCYRALQLIQTGGWDESHGATYFESKSDSTWHSENLTFLFKHGKHYFYKE